MPPHISDQKRSVEALFRRLDPPPDRPITHFQFLGRPLNGAQAVYGIKDPESAKTKNNMSRFILDPDF